MNSSDGGTSPDSGNYYGESESNDGEDEDDGSIGDTARELKSLHLRKAVRYSKYHKKFCVVELGGCYFLPAQLSQPLTKTSALLKTWICC
jgi:hypothetical protein